MSASSTPVSDPSFMSDAVPSGPEVAANVRLKSLPKEMMMEGEHQLFEVRPLLWPSLVRPALLVIAGIIAMAIGSQIKLEPVDVLGDLIPLDFVPIVVTWAGIVLMCSGLLSSLINYLRWKFAIYLVTDRRILKGTGIVARSYIDCLLSKVQNVYTDITFWGRLFGFGTVRIATGRSGPGIRWDNVKNPLSVHRKINEVIQPPEQEATNLTLERAH